MKRRVLGALLALVLAAGGTFVVLSYVNSAEERAVAGEQTVEVLVVVEPVARGTRAEKLGTAVRTARVPAKVRAENAVVTLAQIEGQATNVDLVPGEQLVLSRFVKLEDLEAPVRVEVPEDLLLVTLSLSPERAVGGQLLPGDRVAVVASFDPFDVSTAQGEGDGPGGFPGATEVGGEPEGLPEPAGVGFSTGAKTPNSSHVIIQKVLVTNLQQERLPTDKTIDEAQEQGVELAPTGNLLVTLAVSAPDLEEVIFASEHGTVWLAEEPLTASEAGTVVQTRGTIYR